MNFKNCKDCGAIAVERNVAGEVKFSCGSGIDFYANGWTFVKSDRCLTNGERVPKNLYW